jgi:hypothetical protein
MNIRYVVSHMNEHGVRVTIGNNTRATREQVEEYLGHFLKNNSEETLISIFGKQSIGTFEVSAVECYPVHHDPVSTYIDEELNPRQVVHTSYMLNPLTEKNKT